MISSSFIEHIFQKDRHDLTLEDIKDFFSTPQDETSTLEFKSGDVEIIDLYKEITAFLNTEGGLIIVGAPREVPKQIGKNTVKVCEGELRYSHFKNKDWLYHKIFSNITPPPTDLTIEEFLTPEGNVFLIDVSQSQNPPHQSSSDGRYYLRLERDAKPAPHGIVQALFNKRRVPDLISEIIITEENSNMNMVEVKIRNQSTVPAEKISVIISIHNVSEVYSDLNFTVSEDSGFNKFTTNYNLPHILVQIIHAPFNFKIKHYNEKYVIFVGYWCRDVDIKFDYVCFSPLEKIVIKEGNELQDPNFYEFLEELGN